ncbi:hypothetical protein SAMN04487948_114117 [Halogranum amylolyticum]|uniref:Uncharacterized protein n=1 Tax=Halogranum amylolyticum TaxID=660520 RepID=A0A1H8V796_9EURY|nr:hypothetical protein SAMN04487948_114117 [Halogranum amylolyticum]
MALEQYDVKNYLCVEVYCSVQPRPLTIKFDSGLVDSDSPRLRLRRVCDTVDQLLYLLGNRLRRAFDAEEMQNRFCLAKRQTVSMESDSKRSNGRPQKPPHWAVPATDVVSSSNAT